MRDVRATIHPTLNQKKPQKYLLFLRRSRTSMTIEEIESLERRNAAVHEMGHTVVARHYGIFAVPSIMRRHPTNTLDDKTWVGSTEIATTNMTPQRLRRLAIAGQLAELIDSHGTNKLELEEALAYSYYNDEWSYTDLEGSVGWTSADFRAAFSILKRNWDAIEEGVTALIGKSA